MGLRYTVLASGSAGNCSLVQSDAGGVLLDGGLKPPLFFDRLAAAALTPDAIHGLLLTHTHGDHWNDAVLGWLAERRLPLFCHPSHHTVLSRSAGFRQLREASFVHDFAANVERELPAGLRCVPVPVRHDGGATFAFRVRGGDDLFGSGAEIGYASDLGVWDEALLTSFLDVDLLALEFNHDVELERRSSRPSFLIERVLGDHGHLSNDQAADFVRQLLARNSVGRLAHVVQLHLSNDCNRPALARKALKAVLDEVGCGAKIHTGCQTTPLKTIAVKPQAARRRGSRPAASPAVSQPLLPFEG